MSIIQVLRIVRAAAVLFLLSGAVSALVGCNARPAFHNLDITGNTQFASDFALPDANGKIRTLADYKNKVVVLFFGYMHCPDVCPTTMAELAQTMQQLGADAANRVQVLFVTLDPQRDTANLLTQYVQAFNPSFIGLRPDDVQLKKVAESFHVYYAKTPGKTPGSYTMDHTAASYVFDSTGKLRLFVRDGQGVTPWVHDLQLLLNG